MFEMPVVRVSLATGRADRVHQRPTVDYNLSLSRDGRTLAYRSVEARTMGELTVLDLASGGQRTLTAINPALADLALGRLETVSWRSFDGMEIWGLLLTPPGYDGQRRLPLVVYCHGGPIGGVTLGLFPQFMHVPGQIDPYPTEAMASAGYAVLFPMPRGGSGYGEAGHRMIVNDWGGPDYKDIMAGVDHLIARGVADADRLGVMGASYGGYMTNWIVTQTVAVQGGVGRRQHRRPHRPLLPHRRRRPDGRVLQASVGEPRGLSRPLAADPRREGDDADPAAARRP